MKRIAMCWKCKHGHVPVRCVDGKQANIMLCMLTVMLVKDHSNPPDGCPVKKEWEKEDA